MDIYDLLSHMNRVNVTSHRPELKIGTFIYRAGIYFQYISDDPVLLSWLDIFTIGHHDSKDGALVQLVHMFERIWKGYFDKACWYLSAIGVKPDGVPTTVDESGLFSTEWNGVRLPKNFLEWRENICHVDRKYILIMFGAIALALFDPRLRSKELKFCQVFQEIFHNFISTFNLDARLAYEIAEFAMNRDRYDAVAENFVHNEPLISELFERMTMNGQKTPYDSIYALINSDLQTTMQ
ncbi:uncharacterized protein LOC141856060 [Brevipalpus obovatus]|uniref:uncharacterized protein LOC141856060 n=1 Tax=Brevipalpus obovatus TaxID=246614 RepID=UPI003D9E2161